MDTDSPPVPAVPALTTKFPEWVSVTFPGGTVVKYNSKGEVVLVGGVLRVPGDREGITMELRANAAPVITVDLDKVDAPAANAATLVRIDGVRKLRAGADETEDVWAHVSLCDVTGNGRMKLSVRLAQRVRDVVRTVAFRPWYRR